MATGDGFDQYGNIKPGFIPTYSDSGVHGAEPRRIGLGGNSGPASSTYFEHPSWQARNVAAKAQQGQTGLPNVGADNPLIRAFMEALKQGRMKTPEIPQQKGFGWDLPTLEMGGNVLGGFGKLFSGIGALKTAGYAGDSFREKQKYNALNWQAQLAKRAGEVSGENAMRRDDNAYRTAQGIGHLADYITA